MKIPIESIPQVALAFMNHDHAEFVELREALLAAFATIIEADNLPELLGGFLEHTRVHFAEEERQMTLAGFPAFPVHKAEHDAVLADMVNRIAQLHVDRNHASLVAWLDQPVGEWFINHVRTMDFVTAGFIHAQADR